MNRDETEFWTYKIHNIHWEHIFENTLKLISKFKEHLKTYFQNNDQI